MTAKVIPFRPPVPKPCIDPASRGIVPLYQSGMTCPACRSRAWHVGRLMAECARCGTALDFEHSRGRS